MTFGYPRQVGSRILCYGAGPVFCFFLFLPFDFHLWGFRSMFHIFILLFSLSYAFTTLPILPTAFEPLPTSFPVFHLLCFRSVDSDLRFFLVFCTPVTPGGAQNNKSRRLPGLSIRSLPHRRVNSLSSQAGPETCMALNHVFTTKLSSNRFQCLIEWQTLHKHPVTSQKFTQMGMVKSIVFTGR